MRKFTVLLMSAFWVYAFLIGASTLVAQQQKDYGVLSFANSAYEGYLSTGVDYSELNKQGTEDEATIEFWLKSSNRKWYLTDVVSDDKSMSFSMTNAGVLNIKIGSVFSNSINLSSIVENNEWNHYSLTLQKTGSESILRVYLNGKLRAEFNGFNVDLDIKRNLYFVKDPSTQLSLAELRFWTMNRSAVDVDNFFRKSFVRYSAGRLEAYKDNGLVGYYASADIDDLGSPVAFPRIDKKKWENIINDTFITGAEYSSGLDNNAINTMLENTDHPVISSRVLFVHASKGELDDRIRIKWNHVKNAVRYVVREIEPNNNLVGIKYANELNALEISDDVVLDHKDNIDPGTIYKYTVEAVFEDESTSIGEDYGFIFYNGIVSGHIQTSGQEPNINIDSVEVRVEAASGSLPGACIEFKESSAPIIIEDILGFPRQNKLTLEFWYKPTGTSSSLNSVVKGGNLQVLVSNNKIQVKNYDNVVVDKSITTITDWTHFSVIASPEGYTVYQDTAEIATNTTRFTGISSSIRDIRINNSCSSAYHLDEVRLWNVVRTPNQIIKKYDHFLSGRETGLALYYRMNMGDYNHIYNQATRTKGLFVGTWYEDATVTPKWLPKDSCNQDVAYGAYTNINGDYEITGINYGSDGTNFRAVPYKLYHEFSDDFKPVTLDASKIEKRNLDFGDNSYMEVAGRVYYHDEDDVDGSGEDVIYPVPAGQGFLINGNPLTSGNGDTPSTSLTGSYVIKSPLGKNRIEVQNPVKVNTIGANSLKFNGDDSYAESESTFSLSAVSISGFLSLSNSEETEQVLLKQGELKLIVEDNAKLKVVKGDQELLKTDLSFSPNTYSFFAVSYDNATNKLYLQLDEHKKSIRDITLSLNGKLTLGATLDNNGNPTNVLKANLDDIIVYDKYLEEDVLNKVKGGKIIEDETIVPFAKYLFEEAGGIRTISWTKGGHEKALNLKNGLVFDDKNFHPYSYEYKYEYLAVNDEYAREDNNIAYKPNIIRPLSDVNFENKTRFGIVGNIRIPCGYGVGEWVGNVVRVDLGEDAGKTYELSSDNFNENYTCFTIDGLMPGKYLVKIHRKDKTSDQSLPLEVDITKGWNIYSFDFENPLQVETDIFRKATLQEATLVSPASWSFENVEVCNDHPILQKGSYYDMKVATFQQYTGGKCYIGEYDYTVKKGDLAAIEKRNPDKKAGEFVMPAAGIDTVRFLALEPNFEASENYLREMSIDIPTYKYYSKIPAVILGAQQSRQDFTVNPPEELVMVLHDPPGDNSNTTWSRGHTIDFNTSWNISGDIATTFDVGVITETELQNGVWVGIGGGTIMTFPSSGVSIDDKFSLNVVVGGGYSGNKSYSATLNQSISTEGGGTTVGADADIFIGLGEVLTYGQGKELVRNGCNFSVETKLTVTKQPESMFFHTVQHIKDVLIPNLEELKVDAQSNNNEDQVTSYQNKIDRWNEYITQNKSRIESTETYNNLRMVGGPSGQAEQTLDGAYNFSANSNISFALGKQGSITHGGHFYSNGSLGKDFKSKFKVFGVGVELKTKVAVNWNNSTSFSGGNNHTESFTINLDDDDDGDQFYFYVRQDPIYGSPIFLTYAGRSMCPYEKNTRPREGVELKGDEVAWAEPGKDAVFRLRMKNNQDVDDATTKEYLLLPDLANIPAGVNLKINGGAFNGPKTYRLDPYQLSEEIEIVVKQGASAPGQEIFADIPIIAISACEKSNDTYVYTWDEWETTNQRPADTLYLTAYFQNNCVENIQMLAPQEGWKINSLDNNRIDVKFKLDNPLNSLTKVNLEMVPESNVNNVSIIKAFTMEELTAPADPANPGNSLVDAEGYVSTRVEISRPNGTYRLRLVPACGEGSEVWKTQTPTEWVTGNIQTTPPVIARTEPQNSGVVEANSIIRAVSDKDLKEATVNDLNIILRGILPASEYRPSSAIFNEADDKITADMDATIDLASAYTVEFWMYPESYPSVEVPIVKKGDLINITLTSDGKINNGFGLSENKIVLHRWTHVVVVYNGVDDIRTFFDNDVVKFNSITPNFTNNADQLAICAPVNNNSFRGKLDDLRVWSRARPLASIKIDKKTTLKGDEPGLVFYMPLDDLSYIEITELQELVGLATNVQTNGLTMTSEEDDIAPIDKENSFQTVPANISLVDGNEIIITPTFGQDKLEGSLLVAKIKDKKVKDLYDNPLSGISWSFGYNRNFVSWNRANKVVSQDQGQSTEFTMTITNNGGVKSTFELIGLPAWLSLEESHSENIRYNLLAGHSKEITYRVASWLNDGVYRIPVKAKTQSYDPVTDTYFQTGVETFYLEVDVNCYKPVYNVNSHAYNKQMNFIAKVLIDGSAIVDPADKVVAYVGNEIRGVASPLRSGNSYIVNLTVYSNSASSENITIRVWDDSECTEYVGIDKTLSFVENTTEGSISDPEIWNVNGIISRRFSAVQGYHWLSFNVVSGSTNSLPIADLKGFGNGDNITDKDGNKATWNGTAWTGPLTSVSPYSSYNVELKAQRLIEMIGNPIEVDHDISLSTSGRNWVGYTPNYMLRIEEATRSLVDSLSNGDMCYAKSATAYYQDGEWVGNLEFCIPGQGYQISIAKEGILNYIGVSQAMRNGLESSAPVTLSNRTESISRVGKLMTELRDKASELGYNVNSHAYRHSMHITGVLVDNNIINNEPMIINAYDNGRLVGVSVPQMVDGKLLYFLSTFSNEFDRELEFVVVNPTTKRKFEVESKLDFTDVLSVGNPIFPFEFKIGKEIFDANSKDQLSQNTPNPYKDVTVIDYCISKDSHVQLVITNSMGQKVASLVNSFQEAGCYSLEFNRNRYNIEAGIYFYTLITEKGKLTKKMIIE
ncbi:MAG: LamG-like jellyroll fold domain-containing protein [Hyphomicrobiales bacterium]